MKSATERFFIDAIVRLSERKPLEDITVKDICQECECSRQTFYNHFVDKYDLINKVWEYGDNENLDVLLETGCWSWYCTVKYARYVEKKSFYIQAAKMRGQNSFLEYLFDATYEILSAVLKRNYGKDDFDQDIITDLRFFCYGAVNICYEWIVSGMPGPPGSFTRLFVDNMPSSLKKYMVDEKPQDKALQR